MVNTVNEIVRIGSKRNGKFLVKHLKWRSFVLYIYFNNIDKISKYI